jgi:hypothetical protein
MTQAELERRRAFHESGHICAALQFGIPVIAATISDNRSYMLRGYYSERRDIAVQAMVVLCLSGRASEETYVGPTMDDSDRIDLAMAHENSRPSARRLADRISVEPFAR